MKPTITEFEAVKKFLGLGGYDIIDEINDDTIVAVVDEDGEDVLVFVEVVVKYDVSDVTFDRQKFESIASAWLEQNADNMPCCFIRGDIISMRLIGESKGFLRHWVGASRGEKESL